MVQDGDTYYLDGTLNFAITGITAGASGSFTAYVYGSGLHISGPDYDGDVTADFKETVTWEVTGTTMTMTCDVTGDVGGISVSKTMTFTYEMT